MDTTDPGLQLKMEPIDQKISRMPGEDGFFELVNETTRRMTYRKMQSSLALPQTPHSDPEVAYWSSIGQTDGGILYGADVKRYNFLLPLCKYIYYISINYRRSVVRKFSHLNTLMDQHPPKPHSNITALG